MTPLKIKRSFGTHDGAFHADEVTACALLLHFGCIDPDKIVRTRDMSLLATCEYVCDVGGVYDPTRKLFDHHQADYQGPLSSAGMVLLYLKQQGILPRKEYDFFNTTFVIGVDAHDNGKELQSSGVSTYSHIISTFNPIQHDADRVELESAFTDALLFARGFLKRSHEKYQYIQSCRQIVEEAMAKNQPYLLFDSNIPWLDVFFELGGVDHPALFVVMPSNQQWKLRGIPPNLEHRMLVREPLPQEWAGLLDDELKRVTQIPGAVFCHKGRFISVWETREDALAALHTLLREK